MTRIDDFSSIQLHEQSTELSTQNMFEHETGTGCYSTRSLASEVIRSVLAPDSTSWQRSPPELAYYDFEFPFPFSAQGFEHVSPETSGQYYCKVDPPIFESPVLRINNLNESSTYRSGILMDVSPTCNNDSTSYNSNSCPPHMIKGPSDGLLRTLNPPSSHVFAQAIPGNLEALLKEQTDVLTYDFLPNWTPAHPYGQPDLFTPNETVEYTENLFDDLDSWTCYIDGCGKYFSQRHRYK